jgi:hypothetical protein
MKKSLIIEEVNRINYLMNFDINKSIEDQKEVQISEQTLFEQTQPQQLTPEQIKTAKQKIQASANKTAYTIFGELLKAFDVDGDKDLKDNDGTNEGVALAAIKKIQNKETLDALNKYIASWKQYPNLKSWLNAEMSDFDSEYGNIWNNLEKMGYAGANRNVLLKVAGYTPVGMVVKGADKAIDSLRSLSLEQIMEGFRDIVNGIGGTVATLILTAIPGGQAANMLIYGALTAWDFVQMDKGKGSFFDAILDTFSLLLSGIGLQTSLKPLQGTKAVLGAEKTAVGFFGKMAQKFPKLSQFFNSIVGKIAGGAKWVIDGIKKGVNWLITKLSFLKNFGNMLLGSLNKITAFLDEIVNAIKGTAGKVVTKTIPKTTTLLQKGTAYFTTYAKTNLGPIFQSIENVLGKDIMSKLNEKTVSWIKDKIFELGSNATTENVRPLICQAGKTYCDTFDVIMNGVVATHSVKGTKKTGKETVKLAKGIKKAETGIEKAEKIIGATKAGTKTITKGVGTTDKEGSEETYG